MKRYWLSIVLALFGVCGIAGYYTVGASDELPAFKLTTVSGDPKEADPLQITAQYENRIKLKYLYITTNGSRYEADEGLFDRPRPLWMDYPFYRKLLEDHRGFMRGKWLHSSLYSDENWIVYADVKSETDRTDYTINLDVLDRASGKTNRKELIVPLPDKNNWTTVSDVQVRGEEVHVLVQKGVKLYSGNEIGFEYLDHVFDLTGNHKRDAKIDFGLNSPGIRTNFVDRSGEIGSNGFAGFWLDEEQSGSANKGSKRIYRAYAYNYDTGVVTLIGEARSEMPDTPGYTYENHLEDGKFYIARRDNAKQNLEVVQYDLETNQKQAFNFKYEDHGGGTLQTFRIAANRIYLILSDRQTAQKLLVVLDASNGESVYKARISAVGDEEQARTANVDLRPININYMYELKLY
ncbi:hypothetical protein [Paenibacillus xanthanilyticus]|uniref:Uncharacterized protein n=1 Tax=Paenibacillus xanthanilyticus TaxID=1783531 RepID=A0ABV8K595_9BACL